MPLATGMKLGPFELVSPLGAGGMGEVWRAKDTRLGRDVAIKALPDAFAQDPERLARFEREARLLASLSHPNVAGIHGLELVEGHRYLVLEFVEGETLAQRLARGALPPAEAVELCRQVAAGVEAAHEAGVVHRDLKPGNVMLKPDGTVKVLDFGLAKGGAAHGAASSDPNVSASPTMTYAGTSAGVILGTAAYMSPEQARAKSVDRRTDIWSFGCVLYECLTGRRAFAGETVSDMVARILEREPDWAALPAATPPWLRSLLQRCLTKDVRQRLQAIGEARVALERGGPDAGEHPPRRAARFAWAPWALAAVLGAIALGRGLLPGTPPAAEGRFELGFPAGQKRTPLSYPVLSPDGRTLALAAADSLGTTHVWIRPSGQFGWRRLEGTEGGLYLFWSPDSRSLGFFSKGSLQRVSVEDGTVERIAGNVGAQRGGTWGANGRILYTPGANAGIWSVPAEGGTPVPVTRLDTTLVDASHRFPVWLPDGRHFLFALWSNNARVLEEAGGIYLSSVDGGEPRRVLPDPGSFVLLRPGHLLVRRGRNLVAVPFDTRTFRVGGPAVPVAEEVGFSANSGALLASASERGDVAFAAEEALPASELAWVDRGGRRGDGLGVRAGFQTLRLAPDEAHVAGVVEDATGMSQIWTADLARRTVSRLTRDDNDSYSPAWSPDGARVGFSNRDTGTEDLYVQLAAGTRPKELLWTARPVDTDVTDWSADGRWLLFDGTPRRGAVARQVWAYDAARDSAAALLAADYSQSQGCLSRDGRWLAYVSNESGRDEVYVRSFPDLERKWQVSTAGGTRPHWRRDGRELVYTAPAGSETALLAVAVAPSASGLTVGEPKRLFVLPADVLDFSPAADHSRFLVLYQPAATSPPAMRIMLGWKPEARR